MAEKKNVYLSFHKSFVRQGIEYADRETGEAKTFNQVTLPSDTVIDGVDVSGYQFSPKFVNPSKYKGDDWYDVPLLDNREVWLTKTFIGEDGNPLRDEDGTAVKDTVKVMPTAIKEALVEARRRWAEAHDAERPLAERAATARESSRIGQDNPVANRTCPQR